MKSSIVFACAATVALVLAGCERGRHEEVGGVIQTHFPGEVTAGGGTSGQVLARTSRPVTEGSYAGGNPGMAGGAGGTTGGAATAGTVTETGQGPSQGTTEPSSMGRPGTTLPPGDKNTPAAPAPGTPAAPAPATPAAPAPTTPAAPAPTTPTGAAVHKDNPAPAAPQGLRKNT